MSLISEIQSWLDERKKELIKSYEQSGRKASGNWERELETNIKEKPGKITATIDGARYTEQLIRGRAPTTGGGTGELKEKIREWIRYKNIVSDIPEDSLVYLITRKIHREGITVPNIYNKGTFIDEVFYTTDGTLNELKAIFNKHYVKNYRQEITQGL